MAYIYLNVYFNEILRSITKINFSPLVYLKNIITRKDYWRNSNVKNFESPTKMLPEKEKMELTKFLNFRGDIISWIFKEMNKLRLK